MPSVVEINPITRVEGHGRVRVRLDGNRVEGVELCLTESPRLFEALLLGKSYLEVPEIICRICSLCSTIHKVTALEAVEKALGIEVSAVTRLTRELIACGGMLQDHALHLYCLLLPDVVGVRGVAELARQTPELLQAGLEIKRVGNLIQETVGGRLIHPVNICVGGLGHRMGRDALMMLRDQLLSIQDLCRDTVELYTPFFHFPPLPEARYMAVKMPPGSVSGELITGLRQDFPVARYDDYITETVLTYSHAKYATVLGEEPTVGALARLNVWASLGREAEGALAKVRGELIGQDIRGNSLAQAVELCQAAERSLEVIAELLELGPDAQGNLEVAARAGRGAAACEAPRGVLIHSYGFDDSGICNFADVITPTSLNQGALARDLLALARAMEGADPETMKGSLERLIRCYDPCISCSVHLVRQ
jgi:sulfhydrogenase subunit alpha